MENATVPGLKPSFGASEEISRLICHHFVQKSIICGINILQNYRSSLFIPIPVEQLFSANPLP